MKEQIRNRAITGETIVIDDVELIDCQLIDCQLIYRGGLMVMTRTATVGCKWTFEGTIQALRYMGILTTDPSEWIAQPPSKIHDA